MPGYLTFFTKSWISGFLDFWIFINSSIPGFLEISGFQDFPGFAKVQAESMISGLWQIPGLQDCWDVIKSWISGFLARSLISGFLDFDKCQDS